MKGRRPKPPALRQRRNRVSTAAKLPSEGASRGRAVPPLPPRENPTEVWHPEVNAWWAAVWRSPMAGEFLGPDAIGGLQLLAELYQRRWNARTTAELVTVAAEIRHQEVRFGLSPVDRRRLQWTVELGEAAREKTQTRRRAHQLDRAAERDPRQVLRIL